MLTKQAIVSALGEQALTLPALINEALAANDRLKYRLSLLQLARAHADEPSAPLGDLRQERLGARHEDASLDRLPVSCRRLSADRYHLPGIGALLGEVAREIEAMLAPVTTAPGMDESAAEELKSRAGPLIASLRAHPDVFSPAELEGWLHAGRERGDGVHVLVMDLHRAINALQRSVATEILDGASVYGLAAGDHALVRAFMRGINRTSHLRFDHPGLGTTATRSRDRLLIQNDIGTTDAHVLVVHVSSEAVSITYTDVHLQRLLFFQQLLHASSVDWSDSRIVHDRQMTDGLYHVAVGRVSAQGADEIAKFLDLLGSRLVFLIDWNRARKQLRMLIGKKEAWRLLAWAADHDIGHMGFLRLGGAQAVFDAVDFGARGRGRFGQTLDDLLGAQRAARFLEFVFNAATTELLAGRPASLVHDELRAELSRQLRDSTKSALDLVCEHAGLIVEIASTVRDALSGLKRANGQDLAERAAARCKSWESDADALVNEVRDSARTTPENGYLRDLIHQADDVADGLEEAAFLATLLRPAGVGPGLIEHLYSLASRLVEGSQEFVKALEAVRGFGSTVSREDLKEFIEAIHRIDKVEHETDELKRQIAKELAGSTSAREIHVAAESAADLERASDHLQHVAFVLRDRVITQLS